MGTFRWNDSLKLIDAPKWKDEYKELLPALGSGWQAYITTRFESIANEKDELNIEPHQIDGLSFSMTVVWLIALIRFYKKERLNIVIMGASGKVEERIFVKTNYYEELTNFYPDMNLTLYFVGPELNESSDGKTVKKNDRLKAKFYRGFTRDFLDSLLTKQTVDPNEWKEQVYKALPLQETMFIGYNPGFGSGFEPLLLSWCQDICMFGDLRYLTFFT